MEIGHRLYYDLTSGDVLFDTGERAGDVIETTFDQDVAVYPALKGRTTADTGYVDFTYGDAQFSKPYGSAHVDPATKALTLYPVATITANPTAIPADGTTTSTITVSGLSTTDPVAFSVNGGTSNSITPTNGSATITFKTQVTGTYDIVATTTQNGGASVVVTAS